MLEECLKIPGLETRAHACLADKAKGLDTSDREDLLFRLWLRHISLPIKVQNPS